MLCCWYLQHAAAVLLACSLWQDVLLVLAAYRGRCAVGTYCTLKQAVLLVLAAYSGYCDDGTYIEVYCAVGACSIYVHVEASVLLTQHWSKLWCCCLQHKEEPAHLACSLRQALLLVLATYRGSCAVGKYIEASCTVDARSIESRVQWFWHFFRNSTCFMCFWLGLEILRLVYKKVFFEIWNGFYLIWTFILRKK